MKLPSFPARAWARLGLLLLTPWCRSEATPERAETARPSFPDAASLPIRPEFPSPLVMLDGRKVTTRKQWEEERRPEPEPARRPDRASQVPGSVERLIPAGGGGNRLAGRRDAEKRHADGPHQLEPVPALSPLIEQGDREHERQDRG